MSRSLRTLEGKLQLQWSNGLFVQSAIDLKDWWSDMRPDLGGIRSRPRRGISLYHSTPMREVTLYSARCR
jgi:hypothetical protein